MLTCHDAIRFAMRWRSAMPYAQRLQMPRRCRGAPRRHARALPEFQRRADSIFTRAARRARPAPRRFRSAATAARGARHYDAAAFTPYALFAPPPPR